MYFDFMRTGVPAADGLVCSSPYAGESKDGRYAVLLTAGHCLPPPEAGITPGQLYVSFDRDAGDGVSAPIQMSAFHEMPVSAATSATCATSASCCCGRLGRGGIPAVQLAPAGYWISSAGREPNFGQFLTLL